MSNKITGAGPLYEMGLTFNVKGEVNGGWGGSVAKAAVPDDSTPDSVQAGIVFEVNPTVALPFNQHPYGYRWETAGSTVGWTGDPPPGESGINGADYTRGSWVDWGNVEGDENFITPAVYQIKAVITSQSTNPVPQWTFGSDTSMFTTFIDISTTRQLVLESDWDELEPAKLMNAAMDITIREIAAPATNFVTLPVSLSILDGFT